MRRFLLLLTLLGAASASATTKPCTNGATNPPACTTQPATGSTWWEQHQDQHQGQEQTQHQDQNQHQTATGGNGTGVGVGLGIGQGGSSTAAGGTGYGGAGGSVAGSGNSSSTGGTANSGSSAQGGAASIGNTSTGGNTLASSNTSTSGASADSSGNSSVTIDASDRRGGDSYNSQALFLPDVQTSAPSIVASPVVTIVPGTCGPRVVRVTERAYGTYVGILKRSDLDLGNDDIAVELAPEPFRYHTDRAGNTLVEGSRVDYAAYAVGAAASRGLGVGGGDTGAGWGQAGASSNSSVQRPIMRALITPCLMPPMRTAPAPVLALPEPPKQSPAPRRAIRRRAPECLPAKAA